MGVSRFSLGGGRRELTLRGLLARAALCAALGGAIGVATFFGQGVMPGQSNTLVNSGAVWVAPVFVVGSLVAAPRAGAVAGLITLLATVLGYYGTAAAAGAPVSGFEVMLWAGVALVAGPLYGLAGTWWRSAGHALRITGIVLLGAVFLAEGLFLVALLGYWWSGSALIAAGVVGSLALARRGDRATTLVALPLTVLAAGGVYALLNWAFMLRGA